jgi:hypothetical protein
MRKKKISKAKEVKSQPPQFSLNELEIRIEACRDELALFGSLMNFATGDQELSPNDVRTLAATLSRLAKDLDGIRDDVNDAEPEQVVRR